MPSLRYWKRRQVNDAFRLFREAEEVANELGKAYFQASNYISKQAEEIFDRFRQKWGLSEQDALELISTMRDKASIDELMERLQSNPGTEERQRLKMELESAAFQARINRLKELHQNLDRLMAQIYRNELQKDTDFFRKAADEAFHRYMYNLQQRLNAGFGFGEISEDIIEKILSSDWSGENYSTRIWKNTQKLAQMLKESLLVQLITGSPLHEVIKKIAEKFGVAYRWARRLLLTETSHVLNEVDAHARDELGVEKYMYLATLDLRTSKICRSLDGKIFKTSDRQVGKNFPPMHPHCRSTTIDVLDDDLMKNLTRSALDPTTGKKIKVPLSMTYEKWYEEFVKNKQNLLNSGDKNANIQTQNSLQQEGAGVSIPKQFINNFDDFEKLELTHEEKSILVELNKKALDTGYEYGQAIINNTATKVFTSKAKNYVDIPEDFLQQDNIWFYHAHTNVTLPSSKDLELLCRNNVNGVCVIASNGDVFSVTIGNGYRPSKEEFTDAMKYIQMDVDSSILDREEAELWSPEERTYAAIREQAYRIAREFGWSLKGGRL